MEAGRSGFYLSTSSAWLTHTHTHTRGSRLEVSLGAFDGQETGRFNCTLFFPERSLISVLFISLSLPPGVFLPVHRLRRLHHAALLHARSHHRQRHHLLLTHHHAQRLSGRQSHRIGAARLAGERERLFAR